ncbi:hypothetical protein [Methylophilus sp.]|uniref:hypothetical protein n=1 Tax=Methylophilus sp. TaxID=29541 RepID=UPI004035F0CF
MNSEFEPVFRLTLNTYDINAGPACISFHKPRIATATVATSSGRPIVVVSFFSSYFDVIFARRTPGILLAGSANKKQDAHYSPH